MANEKYYNRDLSWLSFNERVLQEADDNSNGLNERLKFLAIFSSNLDEFYRVRVSKLREFRKLQKQNVIRLKVKPKKIIKKIQKKVHELQERFGYIYSEKLLKQLNSKEIFLVEVSDFNEAQKKFSSEFFHSGVKAHLKMFDLNEDFDLNIIKDKGLFFYINVNSPILISIPTDTYGRFILFPKTSEAKYVTYLDEIIRHNIGSLIVDAREADLYSIKITRDGELYYDEDNDELELIQLIKDSLKDRNYGMPTRILYDARMTKQNIKVLRKTLNLKKTDFMPGGKFHNFSDFFQFPLIEEMILEPSSPQLYHHNLSEAVSIIDSIKTKDELLCFPYQRYDTVLRLINEASLNDDVSHIYITLYRISKDSAVAKALINCLAREKKVTVFIEAKARFDEDNNIAWGEKLECLGATVLYSMSQIKVHSKIMLIETTKGDLGYVGTGNFNEKSAKIYADFALLTANKSITQDLSQVFKFLADTSHKPELNSIWMSPFTARYEIYQRIDKEIKITESGGEGFLFFKMNSLEDQGVIDKLYEASQRGVKVQLLVRGICCLNAGITDLSDNIRIISIVGKYLEHARVYLFGNNGKNDVFIGSADCMERNLDKRVEVMVPVTSEEIKSTIETCLNLQWFDNTKARIIDAKQSNRYQSQGKSKINAQQDFYHFLISKQQNTLEYQSSEKV